MPEINDVKLLHSSNGYKIFYNYKTPIDESDKLSEMTNEFIDETFEGDPEGTRKAFARFLELRNPIFNKDTRQVIPSELFGEKED